MALLLSSFEKRGVDLGLLKKRVDIEDTNPTSKYFVITEFNPKFTAGKNSFGFNGSPFLKDKSEIQIQCLDSAGNSLYNEMAQATTGQFTGNSKFIVSISVYDETYSGSGKLVLVGTTAKGEIVRWIGNINIDKTVSNASPVRFYYAPTLEVRPLLYPILDPTLASTTPSPIPPTAATAKATMVSDGSGHHKVSKITITNHGNGYAVAPNVKFSGGGTTPLPVQATAHAVLSGDEVGSIILDSAGSAYSSTPTITIDSPYTIVQSLNIPIVFTSSFNSNGATPKAGTNQNVIDPKTTDIDYRILLTNMSPVSLSPALIPTASLNSQMIGAPVTLYVYQVQIPNSKTIIPVSITASYTVKDVLDSGTFQLNDAFYYTVGKNQLVANIAAGSCSINYGFVTYNTNTGSQRQFSVSPTLKIGVVQSYAEVTYRNIDTFTGFIARHKLYRKSSFAPGNFDLISDEPLTSIELLQDQTTFNRFYDDIGTFYNQVHVNKYWYPSSNIYTLTAQTKPINSMRIYGGPTYSTIAGNYIIVKNNTIGVSNTSDYIPYDQTQYNNLSGSSYNSNFISLKQNSLYLLTADVIMEKDPNDPTTNVSFYFTSSVSTISQEPTFNTTYGMQLGNIATSDKVAIKYFNGTQTMFFTPLNDYFGTLVIVPYHCNVTLANVSLKLYGDHGFSPDDVFVRIPFETQYANEAFNFKAELYDINHNLVYSNLQTTTTFDPSGSSLFSNLNSATGNTNASITVIENTYNTTTIINGDTNFPDMTSCNDNIRLVGWTIPNGSSSDGKLCYTNVASLHISSSDYISLVSYENGIEQSATALAVRYNFTSGYGRKIFIDAFGTKYTFP